MGYTHYFPGLRATAAVIADTGRIPKSRYSCNFSVLYCVFCGHVHVPAWPSIQTIKSSFKATSVPPPMS